MARSGMALGDADAKEIIRNEYFARHLATDWLCRRVDVSLLMMDGLRQMDPEMVGSDKSRRTPDGAWGVGHRCAAGSRREGTLALLFQCQSWSQREIVLRILGDSARCMEQAWRRHGELWTVIATAGISGGDAACPNDPPP